jgi:hypothetical protein
VRAGSPARSEGAGAGQQGAVLGQYRQAAGKAVRKVTSFESQVGKLVEKGLFQQLLADESSTCRPS